MKILVTGGDGLIGSAITRVNLSHELIPINREMADLRNYSETVQVFADQKPDAIIHCAALVGGIGGNMMKSGDYFKDNILINTNVLEAARETNTKNLTTFMSTCIFPDNASYPLTMDQLHNGAPHPSNFAYAFAKRMLDVQVRAYNSQWGTAFKIIVPTNVYGPNDNFSLTEGHVVASLIHKMYLAKREQKEFIMWGSGVAQREFVFSEDVARVALSVAEIDSLPEPLIVSNSSETSIRKLAETIAHLFSFEGEIKSDISKPDGQLRKPSSDQEFRSLFPKYVFTPIEVGLEKTIDWFCSMYPKVRHS